MNYQDRKDRVEQKLKLMSLPVGRFNFNALKANKDPNIDLILQTIRQKLIEGYSLSYARDFAGIKHSSKLRNIITANPDYKFYYETYMNFRNEKRKGLVKNFLGEKSALTFKEYLLHCEHKTKCDRLAL